MDRRYRRPSRFAIAMLLAVLPACALQADDLPQEWLPGIEWTEGALRVRAPDAHETVQAVANATNEGRSNEALRGIDGIGRDASSERKAELSLAIAGHMDVYDPEEALPCPTDLRPKTTTIDFTWTPSTPGEYRLAVGVVRSPDGEIYSGNNVAEIRVDIR